MARCLSLCVAFWRPTQVFATGAITGRFNGALLRRDASTSRGNFQPDGDESWMQDPHHPALRQFLQWEHTYLSQTLAKPRFRHIERSLYHEFRRRLPQEDATIPECIGSYEYYMRQQPGDNFPVYYRRRRGGDQHATEEIVLDQNQNPMLHQEFHFITAMKISPDEHSMLLVQENADEEFRVVLRRFSSAPKSRSRWNIRSSKPDVHRLEVLEHLGQVRNVEWCSDRAFYFTVVDENRRPHAVYWYDLETREVREVYNEPDEAFFVDVSSTKDNAFVLINCNSKNGSEIRALRCSSAKELVSSEPAEPVLLRAREPNTSYFADHANGKFFIVTNADQAVNYKIAVCDDPPHHGQWRTLLPEAPDVKVEDVDLYEKYLVIYERVQSVPRIRVCSLLDPENDFHVVPLPEQHALCRITPGVNREYKSTLLRFSISTPLVPEIVYDYNLATRELRTLKETRVLDGTTSRPRHSKTKKDSRKRMEKDLRHETSLLDIDRFVCRREFVTSEDGVRVPVTFIHRRDVSRNGKNPTLLMGYGAYGNNMEADFELEHLSLLERSWIIAMAHVRGGGELGLRWYHDGRQLNKMNTFHDFKSVTKHILDEQYTNPTRLAGKGVSAGGLIMGYMANEHPDWFQAMILKVPFVDILDTMQDPTLPLTVHEYDEWGNPMDAKVFEYMKQYAPCANMKADVTYPSMFVTGSMNDIRVQFWEPVKWVHRLRRLNAVQHAKQHHPGKKFPLFLLKMSEDDGHFGGGGRLEQLQEAAMEYAFLYHALRLPFDE